MSGMFDIEYRSRLGGSDAAWTSLGLSPTTEDEAQRLVRGLTVNEGADSEFRAVPVVLGWTVGYRNPRANKIKRVADLDLAWSEAYALCTLISRQRPDLAVYYVSNAAAEAAGMVCAEDIGSFLTDAGRRVRYAETGKLADLGVDVDDPATRAQLVEIADGWYRGSI